VLKRTRYLTLEKIFSHFQWFFDTFVMPRMRPAANGHDQSPDLRFTKDLVGPVAPDCSLLLPLASVSDAMVMVRLFVLLAQGIMMICMLRLVQSVLKSPTIQENLFANTDLRALDLLFGLLGGGFPLVIKAHILSTIACKLHVMTSVVWSFLTSVCACVLCVTVSLVCSQPSWRLVP